MSVMTNETIREEARNIPVADEVDVCVIGGSCTGVFAAVAAARKGAKVAIVENHGFFGGMATASLLGVWQAIPYLFADLWKMLREPEWKDSNVETALDTRAPAYRGYLAAMALLPMAGLFRGFGEIQKFYAVVGAWFLPILALVLLVLNGRSAWVGKRYRNSPLTTIALLGTLLFFGWIAWRVL